MITIDIPVANGVFEYPTLEERKQDISKYAYANEYKFYFINGNSINNQQDLFMTFYKQCEFPGYFGFNWDALHDCLRDYAFAPAKGYIFGLLHSKKVKVNLKQDFEKLIEIFQSAAHSWKGDKIMFVLLLG